MGTFLMDGFLLKKRNDEKSSLVGKYQKRFFKLTTEEFAYASCAKDFKGAGGKIERYPLNELMWVRKREKVKLSLKFPERMLRVKANTEGEANKWFTMLEDAREQYAEEIEEKYFGPSSPQNEEAPDVDLEPDDGILELPAQTGQPQRKKYCDVKTIEMDSDSSDDEEQARVRRAKLASQSLRPQGLPPMTDLDVVAANARSPSATGNRPPSPRSMLANARTGSTIVSKPRREEQESIILDKPPHVGASGSSGIGSRRVKQDDEQLILDGPGARGVAAATSGIGRMNVNSRPDKDETLILGGAPAPAVKAHPGRIELGGPAGRPGFTSAQDTGNWLEEDFDSSDDDDNAVSNKSPAPVQPPTAHKPKAHKPAQQELPSPVATGGVADANFVDDNWDDDD